MAEAAVSILVERLGSLLIEEAKFIGGVGNKVRDIRDELFWMQCFLKDADEKQHQDRRVRTWVREIKDVVYAAEDVLESYILKVEPKTKGGILNVLKRWACFVNESLIRHKIGSEIQAIETRITKLTTRLQTYGVRSFSSDGHEGSSLVKPRKSQLRRSYSYVGRDDFVGLEEEVEMLVERLVNDEYHKVVSISGMGGSGKTTLATKVYNHEKVKHHFDASAWVCIPQEWQLRDILDQILTKLVPKEREQFVKLRDDELMERLFHLQEEKKILIVLVELCHMDTWNCLKFAFPFTTMKGKLLLTSLTREVALHASEEPFIHEPRLLTEDECWDLFKKMAFSKMALPDDQEWKHMEKLGREMIALYFGIPLAVGVLIGILMTKNSLGEWKMVHENIMTYIRSNEAMGEMDNRLVELLALGYNDMPDCLKPCFLYLGKFAANSEIEAESLYQLWIAESMVSSEDLKPGETMMDVAEHYLGQLAQRCMVHVQVEENEDGLRKFKACRLTDLMRTVCLSKAKEEEFFDVIDLLSEHDDEDVEPLPSFCIKTRRLVIFSACQDSSVIDISFDETSQSLRSLLFFNKSFYEGPLLQRLVRSFLNEFRLLRVLAIEGLVATEEGSVIQFKKITFDHFSLSKALGNLVHLRYLSLRGSMFLMDPSFLRNLRQLQTLDLRGMFFSYRPSMRDVLQKMIRLQHLYLPSLHKKKFRITKLRLDGLTKLETLENFDPSWCEGTDLSKLKNLKKLTSTVTKNIINSSSLSVHPDFGSEIGQTTLIELWRCRRLCELEINGPLGDKLPVLDRYGVFPVSLTLLTLCNSGLKEDPMPTLERLPNLKSLSLDLYFGKLMVCSNSGFLSLKSLQLSSFPYLDEWRVEEGALRKLSSLQLEEMSLEIVPDLRFVATLRELKIRGMGTEFTKRVQAVRDGEKGEDFERIGHVPFISIKTI